MHILRLLAAAFAALLAMAPVALSQPETSSPSQPVPTKDPAPPAPAQPKKTEPVKPALPPAPRPVAEITLKVGDKAPPLKPETWVKPFESAAPSTPSAPPVSTAPLALSAPISFELGKVYVVEFWATWCPTCRDAMPALAKLARDHKELTIIAVASSERKLKKDVPDTRLETVRAFVREHDEQMPYPVLFDGARAMASTYIVPAGRVYVPTAFVIDATNTITFIGDPHEAGFLNALTVALKAVAPPPPPKPTTPEPIKKPVKSKPKN